MNKSAPGKYEAELRFVGLLKRNRFPEPLLAAIMDKLVPADTAGLRYSGSWGGDGVGGVYVEGAGIFSPAHPGELELGLHLSGVDGVMKGLRRDGVSFDWLMCVETFYRYEPGDTGSFARKKLLHFDNRSSPIRKLEIEYAYCGFSYTLHGYEPEERLLGSLDAAGFSGLEAGLFPGGGR